MTISLEGKVAIITGASSGIGAAAARRLASENMKLVLAARRADKLTALAEEINAAGGQALPVVTDVTDFKAIRAMTRATIDAYGCIDVLLNNAGIDYPCQAVLMDDEKIRQQVEVNLLGAIFCARAALPHMLRQRSGHILNISSIAGLIGLPGGSVYSATKFGLSGFSDALRREVRWYGVHITLLSLGYVATHLYPLLQRHAEGDPTAPRVLGLMQPEQVAEKIAFLLKHPRFRVVMPWWYRPLAAGAVGFPGIADFIVKWFIPR